VICQKGEGCVNGMNIPCGECSTHVDYGFVGDEWLAKCDDFEATGKIQTLWPLTGETVLNHAGMCI
jgi:hypothetical protein